MESGWLISVGRTPYAGPSHPHPHYEVRIIVTCIPSRSSTGRLDADRLHPSTPNIGQTVISHTSILFVVAQQEQTPDPSVGGTRGRGPLNRKPNGVELQHGDPAKRQGRPFSGLLWSDRDQASGMALPRHEDDTNHLLSHAGRPSSSRAHEASRLLDRTSGILAKVQRQCSWSF